MKRFSLVLFLFVIIFIPQLRAGEGEGGGEVKEKGAGGEYYKHEANLTGLNSKIEADEKNIREMIEEKNQTKDEAKIQEMIDEIRKNLKDRKENIVKFNKERSVMKYQFPDQGKDIDTKYKHFDEKRIKEFEDKVNKLLSSVYDNVKQKYDQGN